MSDTLPFVIGTQASTGLLFLPLAIIGGVRLPDLSEYWFAIAAMFALYAAGHVLYARVLKTVEASVFSTLVTWTAISFLGTPAVLALVRPRAIPAAAAMLTRDGAAIVPLAVFWAASNLASLAAYQHGPASLVAPVQATGVVVTAVIAIVALGEHERVRHKLGAALVSCVGVVLVVS